MEQSKIIDTLEMYHRGDSCLTLTEQESCKHRPVRRLTERRASCPRMRRLTGKRASYTLRMITRKGGPLTYMAACLPLH